MSKPQLALLFPGQGSQSVGMGAPFAAASAAAQAVAHEVDEALGEPLSRLMRDGPEEELTLTANAQPAIMTASLMALAALDERAGGLDWGPVAAVAGHSLGEYSALAAAGSLAPATAAGLLRLRGRAMQEAAPPGTGAMAALLGLALERVEELVAGMADGMVAVANDNAPGQVVVSGERAAVDALIERAKAAGARRAIALAVSAPFHSPLMQPAAAIMDGALRKTPLSRPRVPLMANVTAGLVDDPGSIAALLVAQVTGRVRWRESMGALAGLGATRFLELGGAVLGPMVRRTVDRADIFSLDRADRLDEAVAWLKGGS